MAAVYDWVPCTGGGCCESESMTTADASRLTAWRKREERVATLRTYSEQAEEDEPCDDA